MQLYDAESSKVNFLQDLRTKDILIGNRNSGIPNDSLSTNDKKLKYSVERDKMQRSANSILNFKWL